MRDRSREWRDYGGVCRKLRRLYWTFFSIALATCFSICAHASQNIDVLKNRLKSSNGLESAKISAEIARLYRRSDADQALYYAKISLEQLAFTPHPPTQIHVINTLAIAHLQKREYHRTTEYAETALQKAIALGLPLEQARALNTLGGLNWYRGDLEKAKELFHTSMNLRKQHRAIDELSPVLNNLGVIEEIQGRYHKAIEFYLQAIHYAEIVSNDEHLARPIGNLGILNQMLKNFDKALLYYRRSLALKLKVGDLVGAALAYNNISEIQVENGEYQKAIDSIQAGLVLLEKVEAPQEKALLTLNSGNAFLQLNKADEALSYFDRTKKIVSHFNSQEIDIYLAQGYAEAYLKKNQAVKALDYVQESLILAQAKQDKIGEKKAYNLHYQIYKKNGLHAQALAAHENFFRIHDLLSSKENTEYAERLQAEFESEKKEKELEILLNKNALQEIKIKRQKLIRNLIVALVIFVAITLFFIYRMRTIHLKSAILEQKVAERTQEIQDKNIAIAELLEQKNSLLDRKNTMFSTVSHEFRTPLTLILGPLKNLMNANNNNKTQSTLNTVYRNAARLLRMVDQLLDLARIDMQAEILEEPVDAGAVTAYLAASMETLFTDKDISVRQDIDRDAWIHIAPEALEKIVVNLLSNAVKYTPSGGMIYIGTKAQDNEVKISIRDTGIGIADDQKQRIFERFTRLENQSSSPIPGAGIGLALVKELVECHKGNIKVTSQLNKGSCFTVTFPETSIVALKPREKASSTACENELAILGSPLSDAFEKTTAGSRDSAAQENNTVLIVEDNSEMREFIGEQLKQHYHCLYAEDGRQGISKAIREVPDLIISDLMMPYTNGLELAATLKEEQLTSHIPIVILTAKGDTESRHSAWKKNVDEYIEKPFDAEELLLRCENILSIRQLIFQRFAINNDDDRDDLTKGDTKNLCFNARDREFLVKLNNHIEENYPENTLNANSMSSALAITEKQLQRKVKALTGHTIPAFVRNFRLKKGADLLANGSSITSVAFDVGFSSQSYFSSAFSARYGCSPSDYQQQHKASKESGLVV